MVVLFNVLWCAYKIVEIEKNLEVCIQKIRTWNDTGVIPTNVDNDCKHTGEIYEIKYMELLG